MNKAYFWMLTDRKIKKKSLKSDFGRISERNLNSCCSYSEGLRQINKKSDKN